MLAVLMAAIAPSVSHALVTKLDPTLVQVCSVSGFKWVDADGQPVDASRLPQSGHFTEHCPYCSLHANALPVPAMQWSTPVELAGHRLPVVFLAVPRKQPARVSAQPRAPPFLS